MDYELTFRMEKNNSLNFMRFTIIISFFFYAFFGTAQNYKVIKDVNIIPMNKKTVLKNMSVLIKDATIEKIGKNIKIPKNSEVINGKGKFLLPGFINMYTHVNESNLMLYLANGQTTVRDLPSHINVLGLREDVKKGKIVGPNIIAYGLRATGAPAPFHTQQPIFTAEQGKQQVREAIRLGYDGMFIYATCKPETYEAILNEAEKLNFPISGHFPIFIKKDRVMNSKQKEFDNLTGLTRGGNLIVNKENLLAALRKHKKAITPSLAVHYSWSISHKKDSLFKLTIMDYIPKKLKINWRPDSNSSQTRSTYNYQNVESFIKELSDNDIQLFLGSDGGYPLIVPGFAFLDEMKLFAKAGISNHKILKYATLDAAKFLNLNKGIIAVGKDADLVLLNKNPLEDIKSVENIQGVMIGGRWLNKQYLSTELSKLVVENKATKNRFDRWTAFLNKKETSRELSYTFYNKDTEVGAQKIVIDTLSRRQLGIQSVMVVDSPDYRETYSYYLVNNKRMDSMYIQNRGSEGKTEASLVRKKDTIYITGYSPFHGNFNYTEFAPPGTQLWAPFASRYFELENVISYISAIQFIRNIKESESDQFKVYQIELNSEEYGKNYILDMATTVTTKMGQNEYRVVYPGFSGFASRTNLPFTIKVTTNKNKIPIEIINGDQVIKLTIK